MATIVFDFDSTLITKESLEIILADSLRNKPDIMARIEALTAKGMAGGCSFAESLGARLALAAPRRQDVAAFGDHGHHYLTAGMADLVADLLKRDASVHIVSGGLVEAIRPVALKLGIAANQVHAVQLRWSETGTFLGVDPEDPFSQSKVLGFAPLAVDLPKPIVIVGDGMTDYQLYEADLADHFVAFCQNVHREAVVARAQHVATSTAELATLLELWL